MNNDNSVRKRLTEEELKENDRNRKQAAFDSMTNEERENKRVTRSNARLALPEEIREELNVKGKMQKKSQRHSLGEKDRDYIRVTRAMTRSLQPDEKKEELKAKDRENKRIHRAAQSRLLSQTSSDDTAMETNDEQYHSPILCELDNSEQNLDHARNLLHETLGNFRFKSMLSNGTYRFYSEMFPFSS
jgi:hypothetical protein